MVIINTALFDRVHTMPIPSSGHREDILKPSKIDWFECTACQNEGLNSNAEGNNSPWKIPDTLGPRLSTEDTARNHCYQTKTIGQCPRNNWRPFWKSQSRSKSSEAQSSNWSWVCCCDCERKFEFFQRKYRRYNQRLPMQSEKQQLAAEPIDVEISINNPLICHVLYAENEDIAYFLRVSIQILAINCKPYRKQLSCINTR